MTINYALLDKCYISHLNCLKYYTSTVVHTAKISHPVSMNLMCSIFYWLFLPVPPKNYPLFLFYSHINTYYSHIIIFINVSDMYWHLEKQELDMYWFCYRYTVQILVIQVNGLWILSSPSLNFTHLSYHCFLLILISNKYQ